MTTTADILRAAANLIDSGQTDSPVDAILQAAPPGEAVTALRQLAAHLSYGADRNPRNALTRWASMRSRDVVIREIRAAAHTTRPSVRGGPDIGHAAEHDYRHQEQNDRD